MSKFNLDRAAKFSDMGTDKLKVLTDALTKAPTDGIALEVGTRKGGSALLMCESKKGIDTVICVDPYGSKPYPDVSMNDQLDFNDQMYMDSMLMLYAAASMNKKTFIPYKMTSQMFMQSSPSVWIGGRLVNLAKDQVYSYVLLDGEHNWTSVTNEINFFSPLVKPGGVIVVDNADWFAELPHFDYPRQDMAIRTFSLSGLR